MFLSARNSGKRSGGGASIRSISPASSALAAVLGSEMASHSTRSTLAILAPASIEGGSVDGTAEGSTFSQIFTTSGLVNFYEDTPFYATGASDATQNINDAFVFDPTGSPLTDLSGIEFGIQYLDLPDATSGPIDAINFLGSGGEILFSIPVTGDLLAGL